MTEDFSGLVGTETEVVSLAPGEALFEKGEPAHCMYVVKSGELQIIDGNFVYETVSAAFSARWLCWMRLRAAPLRAPSGSRSSFPSTSAGFCSWCNRPHSSRFA
jgi:hypothetical protein